MIIILILIITNIITLKKYLDLKKLNSKNFLYALKLYEENQNLKKETKN